jgi:hypothetical protein
MEERGGAIYHGCYRGEAAPALLDPSAGMGSGSGHTLYVARLDPRIGGVLFTLPPRSYSCATGPDGGLGVVDRSMHI